MFLVALFHFSRCYHHSGPGFIPILYRHTHTSTPCARRLHTQLITFTLSDGQRKRMIVMSQFSHHSDWLSRRREREEEDVVDTQRKKTHKNSCIRIERNRESETKSFRIPVRKEQLGMDTKVKSVFRLFFSLFFYILLDTLVQLAMIESGLFPDHFPIRTQTGPSMYNRFFCVALVGRLNAMSVVSIVQSFKKSDVIWVKCVHCVNTRSS